MDEMCDVLCLTKKVLCRELNTIVSKDKMSAGDLDVVDKLTHSIKAVVTTEAMLGSDNDISTMKGRKHLVNELNEMLETTKDLESKEVLKHAIYSLTT